jgi:hypothetical protein
LERIGFGTSISTPPSASITVRKSSKSTMTTWFGCKPVSARTVFIVSAAPPSWKAALILYGP